VHGYKGSVALPTMRRLAVVLSGASLVVALAVLAFQGTTATAAATPGWARTIDADGQPKASTVSLAAAAVEFRGGPITTSTGETVDVRVSDSLPPDVTPENWAEFLAQLDHGPELGQLTVFILTFDEVEQACGSRALGCYARDQLIAPGETVFDTTPEEVVRHEYGHHIAYHRLNSPWTAIDWGPKRWASVENVCSRVARNQAYPGNEGANYALNPGEAWAETYRILEERKAGITTGSWPIIDQSFFPSDAALTAAQQDVTQPWTASHTRLVSRVFGKKAPRMWWIPLVTTLDGDVRVSATVPSKSGTVDVALVGADRKTVVRRAQWVSQRVKRLDGSICGQRSLFVRVTQTGVLGRVRISVTTP
jgi:hypothetical protein